MGSKRSRERDGEDEGDVDSVQGLLWSAAELDELISERQSNREIRSRLGPELRRLRAQRKLLQKQVAIDASLDASYLARLEGGTRQPPRLETLRRLSAALKASAEEGRVLTAAAVHDHAIQSVTTYLHGRFATLVLEVLECAARLRLEDARCVVHVARRLASRTGFNEDECH